jgi:hypothetical protein
MKLTAFIILFSISALAGPTWPTNVFSIDNTVKTILNDYKEEFKIKFREAKITSSNPLHRSLQFDDDHTVHLSITRERSENTLVETIFYFKNSTKFGALSIIQRGAGIKETPNKDLFHHKFMTKEDNILSRDLEFLKFDFSWTKSSITIAKNKNERFATLVMPGSSPRTGYILEKDDKKTHSRSHWWACNGCSGKKIIAIARNIDTDLWQIEFRQDPSTTRLTGLDFYRKQENEYFKHLYNIFTTSFTSMEDNLLGEEPHDH